MKYFFVLILIFISFSNFANSEDNNIKCESRDNYPVYNNHEEVVYFSNFDCPSCQSDDVLAFYTEFTKETDSGLKKFCGFICECQAAN